MKDKNIHYTYFKIIYCSLFPFKEYAKDEVKETWEKKNVRQKDHERGYSHSTFDLADTEG